MIYVLLGLGLLFFIIGAIITKDNTKYLLSGYYMMSEIGREKVDIVKYYK